MKQTTTKTKQWPKQMEKRWKPMNNTFDLLAIYSRAKCLPWNVLNVPSVTPLDKTNFPLPAGVAAWLGVRVHVHFPFSVLEPHLAGTCVQGHSLCMFHLCICPFVSGIQVSYSHPPSWLLEFLNPFYYMDLWTLRKEFDEDKPVRDPNVTWRTINSVNKTQVYALCYI